MNSFLNKIFLASKNKGKISEIKSYLNGFGLEVFSLIDTPNINDIEETGNSFEENALLKAKAVYNIVKIPVLSDDSGLEVDLLDGRPGIYSARYSGINADDKSNNEKLLAELRDSTEDRRTARFRCVLCLYDGENSRFFEGVCEGKIDFSSKGKNGFGYDPLFIPSGYSNTFGELSSEVKSSISHRAKALLSLKKYLELEKSM